MKVKKLVAGILLLTMIICGLPRTLYASSLETAMETTMETESGDLADQFDFESETAETEVKVHKSISGFLDSGLVVNTEKDSLEALVAQLPETAEVILSDGSQEQIAAVWHCDEDYEKTEYDSYVFSMELPEGYVLDEGMTEWDLPYVEVNILPADNHELSGEYTEEAQDGDTYFQEGVNMSMRAASTGTVSIIWYSVAAGSGLGALLGDGKDIDHICYMQIKTGGSWHTAFCVQHTAPMRNGYDVETGGEALTTAQRNLIGEILCYAPDFSSYSTDISKPPTSTDFAKYTATQMAIWLVTVDKFGTAEGDSIAQQVCDKSKQADSGQSYKYYQEIRAAVKAHQTIPSFTASTADASKIYEMVFNSDTGQYELNLTDDNKIIGSFAKNDAFNKNNMTSAISGHTMTLSAPEALDGTVTLGLSRKIKDESKAYQLWWNPENTSQQELVTVKGLVNKELLAYFKIKAVARTGYLQIMKASGNTAVTDGNTCYSLDGAVYTVYDTNTDGVLSGEKAVLTTDADGNSNIVELAPDTYYIRETKAAKGYQLDETIYTAEVSNSSTEAEPVKVEVADMPSVETGGISITKVMNGKMTDQCPSLEGTLFTVKYYDGYYTSDTLPAEAERTWVIQTLEEKDQTCKAVLNDTYKVAGDDFYYSGDTVILPLGTVTIQETQAAPGYTLKGYLKDAAGVTVSTDGEVYVTQITEEKDRITLQGGNHYISYDTPVNGRIKIVKYDSDGRTPLKGVSFELRDEEGHRVAEKTTGDDGTLVFENLYPGVYKLTETATIPGYSLLAEDVEIILPLQLTEDEAASQNVDIEKCIYDEQKSVYYVYDLTYEISNGAALTLPATGGTYSIWTWLPLLCAFSIFWLLMKKIIN